MAFTNEYLAWVAGFFDGEGSVSISHIKSTGQYYLHVRIVQNIEHIIKKLSTDFAEGTSVYKDKAYDNNAKRPIWRLCMGNKRAYNFLKLIYPYLRIKRKQAELGIQFQDMLYSGAPPNEKNILRVKFKEDMMGLNSSPVWIS